MKYIKEDKATGAREAITFDEAKAIISNHYAENVCSYDEMLASAGTIPTLFYNIIVAEA